MLKINEPLVLDGAENIRELGGYETTDGRVTKSHVYLRGDRTDLLSAKDILKLEDYGVTLELDLRSPNEVEAHPSKFLDHSKIKYKNVVMFDTAALFASHMTMPKSLTELYIGLLDNAQEQYGEIFKAFLDNDGVSFFHCSAGKDRTGVLAMLILDLAGVPEATIVADYEVSEKHLVRLFKEQKIKLGAIDAADIPQFLFSSAALEMENTIKYFREKYVDAKNYLKLCGLSEEEIIKLKEKFLS